jgi:hypothetical protein
MPKTQADWNQVVQTLTEWRQSVQANPSSVNVIPSQFSIFQGSSLPILTATGCTASLDAAHTFYGANALKIVVTTPGATLTLSGFPIAMAPATRWFGAFQLFTAALVTGTLSIKTSAGNSASQTFSVAAGALFQQTWGLFDLRKFPDTQSTWQFTFDQPGTFWLDGLQMVATGSIFTGPIPFGNSGAPGSTDQLPDGSTYARILGTQLSSGSHKLTVAGSGMQLGDQRNKSPISTLNLTYKWPGVISYTSTATTATISVGATTVLLGTASVSYNAMSVNVSGTGTAQYFLYVDDPTYAGGTRTLVATTNGNDLYASDGRVFVGQVAVTFIAGGTGAGGGGGGGACVTLDTWLPGFARAREVKVGEDLKVADPITFEERFGRVSYAQVKHAECVRIRTESGIELDCSSTAPIAVEGGERVLAPDLLGHRVPVCDRGEWHIERVTTIEQLGTREVMYITCEDSFFLAGRDRGRYLLHHNAAKP